MNPLLTPRRKLLWAAAVAGLQPQPPELFRWAAALLGAAAVPILASVLSTAPSPRWVGGESYGPGS
jgi:hypothetical protein